MTMNEGKEGIEWVEGKWQYQTVAGEVLKLGCCSRIVRFLRMGGGHSAVADLTNNVNEKRP